MEETRVGPGFKVGRPGWRRHATSVSRLPGSRGAQAARLVLVLLAEQELAERELSRRDAIESLVLDQGLPRYYYPLTPLTCTEYSVILPGNY